MNNYISREICERLYDLDGRVYETVGSSLGRTFTGDRENTILRLQFWLTNKSTSHLFRNEMALVGNMARTIKDKPTRQSYMREYDAIMQDVIEYQLEANTTDIADPERVKLNTLNFNQKFRKEDRLVICISRSVGSAGNDIGFALADTLHMNYYDGEILTQILDKETAEDQKIFETKAKEPMIDQYGTKVDLNLVHLFKSLNRYHGLTKKDAIFFKTSELIIDIAKNEDCVIMGRCADSILKNNHIPHVSIHIDAPFKLRAQRLMAYRKISYLKACYSLYKEDRKHKKFYNFYSNGRWGAIQNYDLSINSANYGISETVNLITRMITHPVTSGVKLNEDHAVVNRI